MFKEGELFRADCPQVGGADLAIRGALWMGPDGPYSPDVQQTRVAELLHNHCFISRWEKRACIAFGLWLHGRRETEFESVLTNVACRVLAVAVASIPQSGSTSPFAPWATDVPLGFALS